MNNELIEMMNAIIKTLSNAYPTAELDPARLDYHVAQIVTENLAQAERIQKLEAALRPFADCGAFFEHPITRLANEDRSLRSFSNTALLSDYVSNPIDRLKVRDFRRATSVYLRADSQPPDWTRSDRGGR